MTTAAQIRKLPVRPSPAKVRVAKARPVALSREGFARIVVDVPEQTHRNLKAKAAMDGQSIKEYVLEMLAEAGIGG